MSPLIDYRPLAAVRCDSEANEDVIAEYVALEVEEIEEIEEIEEELGVRICWRLRVTQLSHRPFCVLQRPRQPRS